MSHFPVLRRGVLVGACLSLFASPQVAAATEAEPYRAPRDRASYDRALQCLSEAIYYEARSESEAGQRAVAQVVLNRVRHPSYPSSVCGVVYQGSERRTGCQFTFTCDGSLSHGIRDGAAWERAQRIAGAALQGSVYRPVGLSLNYHTTAIRPYWAPSLRRQVTIGAHIFYTRPGSRADMFNQAPSGREPEARAAVRRDVAPRSRPDREPRATYATARVERPQVERPTVQQVAFERPIRSVRMGTRPAPTPRPRATVASTTATPAAPARSGPRSTIERGVRVSRGS